MASLFQRLIGMKEADVEKEKEIKDSLEVSNQDLHNAVEVAVEARKTQRMCSSQATKVMSEAVDVLFPLPKILPSE